MRSDDHRWRTAETMGDDGPGRSATGGGALVAIVEAVGAAGGYALVERIGSRTPD